MIFSPGVRAKPSWSAKGCTKVQILDDKNGQFSKLNEPLNLKKILVLLVLLIRNFKSIVLSTVPVLDIIRKFGRKMGQ